MASQYDVTITDSLDLLRPALEHLRAAGLSVLELPPGIGPDGAAAAAAGSPAVIVGVLAVGAPQLAVLAQAGTGLVVRAGIGYDNVDVAAADGCGIAVANVPDYCVHEVADHTLLLLLAATRRLVTLRQLGRAAWDVAGRLPPVHRIAGRTLGVVGLGRIGRQVARRGAAFGFTVIAHDPVVADEAFAAAGATSASLDDLFDRSDAVTLHCPLTAATHHIVDDARLTRMRPGAVLVNTSRGGLVDLDAVRRAIDDGRLGAVALDVLDGEPDAPLGHPLLQHPNALVTPHVAWYSLDARRELAIKSAEEALRFVRGQPVHNAVGAIRP